MGYGPAHTRESDTGQILVQLRNKEADLMNLYLGGFPVDARGMHHLMQVENLPFSAGDERDMGMIPGSERSPGRGNGNPLQYSCLENPIDRGAWRATVYRFEESDMTEAT